MTEKQALCHSKRYLEKYHTFLLVIICGSEGKASACSVGDPGSIPGSGRSPGERNGNPLQYTCLENSMDGGARRATVCGVQRVDRLSDFTFTYTLPRFHQFPDNRRKPEMTGN